MNNFMTRVAVLLSVLALGGTGFAIAQILQLQQSVRELSASGQNTPAASELPEDSSSDSPQENTSTPATEPTQQSGGAPVQPGQFVQYAFEDRAQVELLSVRRIENPEDGTRNIVNVQMRVRNLKGNLNHVIVPELTIARNPETNERYESLDRVVDKIERERSSRNESRVDRSTGAISMGLIEEGSSVDGYVWIVVPEEINTIDLIVPDTAIFVGVPIAK